MTQHHDDAFPLVKSRCHCYLLHKCPTRSQGSAEISSPTIILISLQKNLKIVITRPISCNFRIILAWRMQNMCCRHKRDVIAFLDLTNSRLAPERNFINLFHRQVVRFEQQHVKHRFKGDFLSTGPEVHQDGGQRTRRDKMKREKEEKAYRSVHYDDTFWENEWYLVRIYFTQKICIFRQLGRELGWMFIVLTWGNAWILFQSFCDDNWNQIVGASTKVIESRSKYSKRICVKSSQAEQIQS